MEKGRYNTFPGGASPLSFCLFVLAALFHALRAPHPLRKYPPFSCVPTSFPPIGNAHRLLCHLLFRNLSPFSSMPTFILYPHILPSCSYSSVLVTFRTTVHLRLAACLYVRFKEQGSTHGIFGFLLKFQFWSAGRILDILVGLFQKFVEIR